MCLARLISLKKPVYLKEDDVICESTTQGFFFFNTGEVFLTKRVARYARDARV